MLTVPLGAVYLFKFGAAHRVRATLVHKSYSVFSGRVQTVTAKPNW